MSQDAITPGATYFGKVPARGDFIKGSGNALLIGRLDQWVSESMALLANDPRWKIMYDDLPHVQFAFVGARSRMSVIGHLKSSMDSSQRRFPFLTAAAINRDDSLLFRCGPISFSSVWSQLHDAADVAFESDDPAASLDNLSHFDCAATVQASLQADPLGSFVRNATIEQLEQLLSTPDRRVDVRRIILAIGLLLSPTLENHDLQIDKGLMLPLPDDAAQRDQVAGLWVYLVTAFLRHTGCELQLLIGRCHHQPCLVIGFQGASPRTLLSLLAPLSKDTSTVILEDPEWVESHESLQNHYGIAKLSAYLQQPALTLEDAVNTFREVFFGE